MLYHLLYSLHTQFSFFNVFRYITLRTIYATLTALVITFFLGPVVIRLLDPVSDRPVYPGRGPPVAFE